MEIVVRGRHLTKDVGDSFRAHCASKLERLERLDHRLMRLDVELSHEPNPRLADRCQRVEITCRTRGPVVRAEAAAADCYAAFEKAFAKLEERLRRAATRRQASHSHSHHSHAPVRAPAAGDGSAASPGDVSGPDPAGRGTAAVDEVDGPEVDGPEVDEVPVGSGLVVRVKTHCAPPQTVEDALHAMELVGHDFYLFTDATTGGASVVYRRRGYDYGLLRLEPEQAVLTAVGR